MPLIMCPNCNCGMQAIARNDVQIDMCPQCRGVWLDRGELEKILGAAREVESEWEAGRANPYAPPHEHERGYVHPERHGHRYGYGKKPKSRFKEIFDIFD